MLGRCGSLCYGNGARSGFARKSDGCLHQLNRRQCPISMPALVRASAQGTSVPDPTDQPGSVPSAVNILPRLRERDPFKVLGIPSDSDFEEVLQARNYLVETAPFLSELVQEYREHEKSREHVELAFERIVSQSFKDRQRKGFRPSRSRSGKTQPQVESNSGLDRLKQFIDPSVTMANFARDTVMFVAIAVWSYFTVPMNTAAIMIAFGYAAYRSTVARKIRNPDGPYFGDSPVFGAVLKVLLCFVATNILAGVIGMIVPWQAFGVVPEQANGFIIIALLGPLNIMLR